MMYREHQPRLAVSPWRARCALLSRACGWMAAACFAASAVALVASPASLAVPMCWGAAVVAMLAGAVADGLRGGF